MHQEQLAHNCKRPVSRMRFGRVGPAKIVFFARFSKASAGTGAPGQGIFMENSMRDMAMCTTLYRTVVYKLYRPRPAAPLQAWSAGKAHLLLANLELGGVPGSARLGLGMGRLWDVWVSVIMSALQSANAAAASMIAQRLSMFCGVYRVKVAPGV